MVIEGSISKSDLTKISRTGKFLTGAKIAIDISSLPPPPSLKELRCSAVVSVLGMWLFFRKE